MQPLPELAELRDAVYVGGKKVFSDDYLKQLTPLSLADLVHGRRRFTVRSKGLQSAPRAGAAASEICVEAIRPTPVNGCVEYLADTWGIAAKLARKGRSREGRSCSSRRPRRRSSRR